MNEYLADWILGLAIIGMCIWAAIEITNYAYGEPSEIIGTAIYNLIS